jgi:hypothetical protein
MVELENLLMTRLEFMIGGVDDNINLLWFIYEAQLVHFESIIFLFMLSSSSKAFSFRNVYN